MLLSVLGLLVPLAGGTCLSNGVPPAERKLLVNANGDSYPLGVWGANYAASFAANTMVEILVEEVFGLETTNGFGAGTVDGAYGMVPCTDPTNIADRGCDDEGVSKFHVHMESWVVGGYPLVWEEIQNLFPKSSPVNLGNMGYNGESSEYAPQAVIQQGKQTEGVALQYYAFYNASWYDPAKYFESVASINASKYMMPCGLSIMADAGTAARHVQFTGDVDGVVTENGTHTAMRCFQGYWWFPPSCRSNSSACVPYNTGGIGWGWETVAQRAVILHMPIAISVAKSWTEYTQYPLAHPGTLFYWWTPDPTFIELDAQVLIYPPYNRRQKAAGFLYSQDQAVSIDKLVSRDLSSLAPNVQNFVEKIFITMDQMNDILRSQKGSGESWRNVTCEWLRANEAQWQAWIPDESQCFPGFGLFDSVTNEFTDTRVNATNKIICQACPSGTFSQALSDGGETFICVACPAGTSQPSGASLSCKPCKEGEYQDETGASTCKRCAIGDYQDEIGMLQCKTCPATTTTLGPGSVGPTDCGCTRDEINVNEIPGAFTCEKCSEGVMCPDMSNLADLRRGESELGEGYTPMIIAGYYSTEEAPLEVYRCGSVTVCPGGKPNSCAGGDGGKLLGVPCAKCPEGSTWTGSTCEDCAGWRQALWAFAVVCIFAFLTLAYYLTTSKVTAKATVLFATTASFGMLVMAMQNLGLIGMMTVAWPDDLNGIFSICQFLLLDIDSYGFSCIAGQSSPVRYILSAAIFPAGVAWLAICWATTQLLPKKRRWDGSKVLSCMGAFLQVGFSTMSATSLAPMMCYLHPNGQRSILKYPDVICGSSDHNIMLVAGWLLLSIFVLGFVTVCSCAVWMVPSWSARRKDRYVAAVRFLVFRFRLDSWWFGVPLLIRGPLLSLPVVLATDYPPVQIMTIASVMAVFLVMQMLAWPWKVPMLNLTDCVITFCITLLVTTSSLFLPPVEGPMVAFASGISTAMLSGIGIAMGIMCCMTASALIYRGAMGGKKELRIFNLGKVANSATLAAKVKDLAIELEKLDRSDLATKISGLAVFDMNKITACITLLATEVAPPEEGARTYKFNPRINSSSFDPSLKRSKVSKRSTRSSNSAEAVEEANPEAVQETNEEPANRPARTSENLKSQWI